MSKSIRLADTANVYGRLLYYILPYKWVFIAGVVGMLVVAAGDTAAAWILQPLMDKGFVERDATYITWIPVFFVLISLARALGALVDGYCMQWIARKVVQDLRQKMFERLLYVPAAYYDHYSIGVLVSRLTYDVEQVARASSGAFRTLFRDLLKTIFLLSLMFYLSWKLSVIFILIFPLAYLIFKYSSGRFRNISSRIQESVGEITHLAKQTFQCHQLVKMFGAYEHEKSVFFLANNANRQQAMKKVAILCASVTLLVFIVGVGVAVVIWLALILEIKPGVFTSYLVSMTMVVRPIKNLSKVNETIQTGMAGAESVFNTLDLYTEEDEGTHRLDHVTGNISFEKVSFYYTDASNRVLKEISFEIPAGTTVALVGPSGSGKSTIASIMMRFYPPTSGQVYIDRIPIEETTLESFRDNTAMVSQEVMLFEDSIRNNIAYGGTGGINEDRLMAAVEAANCREFMEIFPDGLDTNVGESGIRLSGGQRQRIAIARALYKDAPVMILDEATSSLDSGSEKKIQKAIDRLIENRTTLIIAHRLSTIENADHILVLENGEIVERGTHRSLLEEQGTYFHLYHAQHRVTDSGQDTG